MKARKNLNGYQFLFYTVIFIAETWSSLHNKKLYETILYSVALAASVFLAALFLSGWGVHKTEKAQAQEEHQEEMI